VKIKNKIPPLLVEIVVLPREGEDMVFKARGVLNPDYEEFEKLCPAPVPPWITLKDDPQPRADITDPEYLAAQKEHSANRFYFMCLKSLSATEDLEWETVKINDPKTWKLIDKELKSVLTSAEYVRVVRAVHIANGLDDTKIEAAKTRFFNMARQKQEKSSLPQTGQPNT